MGKRFFLQLGANAIEDVNILVDSDNVSYTKKAMTKCNLALEIDGTWTTNQLFPHFQKIITKHHDYFQGFEVSK